MGEEKKGGKIKKFFLFAAVAGLVGGVVKFLKRRRGQGVDDSEWQELPPPTS